MLNAANRIFGSIDGNFDQSAGPINTTREEIYSQHAIYMPYTFDRSEVQMWTFFKPGVDAAVAHESISKSIEIGGCQRQATSLSYYPSGQLKAEIEVRDGLVLEEKRYNERGRRQSNPLRSTLNEIRTDLLKSKCSTE